MKIEAGQRYRHCHHADVQADVMYVTSEHVIYKSAETRLVEVVRWSDFLTMWEHVGPRPRPSPSEYFMQIAHAVAARGTCDRRRVGAIAVREGRILATGYNGSPPGVPHCGDVGHDLIQVNGRDSCSRAIHAEANVLAYAARYGVSVEGASIYCNTFPCHPCAKAMVSAGIIEVAYDSDYNNDPLVQKLAQESGLRLVRVRV